MKPPQIEYEGKKYIFSIRSILIFAIGTPLISFLIYFSHDWVWLHEIVSKQTVWLMNLITGMGASVEYRPFHGNMPSPWFILIPGKADIGFTTFCTGIQAIAIFTGIILTIPHSKDPETSKDIWKRKLIALVVSSAIFYVVNIIRMVIQLDLYYIGYAWEDIHYSISAASSFIAAIIILLLHKWIPEFVISIIYVGVLIKRKIKKPEEKELIEETEESSNLDLKEGTNGNDGI
jgi:exosortase/archaeosortase family protein